MDNQTGILGMLELMTAPAFCVKDAKVDQMNTPARQLMLKTGTPLSDLLGNQLDTYQTFDGGCLFVTVHLGGIEMAATVNRIGKDDIFVIDQQAQAELRIMALVAQDLRMPLADVICLTDRLLPAMEASADETGKQQISRINRKLTQLNRTLLNMADAIRYSTNHTPEMTLCDVVAVVDEIAEHADALLEHTNIKLHLQLPQESILCCLDTEKLERAIYNLLSNAIKASAPGDAVELNLWSKNGWIYLSVQDSGSGIPSDIIGNIFTRYQRSAGLEDSRNGLGLGMVLVRSAAAAHGGTVLIQQPKNGGTKITVSFPIRATGEVTMRSPILQPDYAGERDHGLLELSEVLPPELYRYHN